MQYPSFLPVNYTVKFLSVRLCQGGRGKILQNGIAEQPFSISEVTVRTWTTPDDQPNHRAKRLQANSVHKEYKNSLRKEGTEKTILEN